MSAYKIARPQAGERVAVIGIGGLGHLALQIAKSMGNEVVAITNTPGKAADAREMGADEVLVIKSHVGQELQAIGGADVILSFSPAMKQNSQAMEGLRAGGRLVKRRPAQNLFKLTQSRCYSNKLRFSARRTTIPLT